MRSCAADLRRDLRLKIKLQPKLKLPWIEGGRGTAEIAAIAGALVEQPHVIDET